MACGPGCDCHCCAGIDAETPVRLVNPPGLPQISYRSGRHAEFMESLKARLSSADYPALSALTTREESDTTLALFDALASSLDVLSFYVERYANECYLRTATERLSVIEMARLIGYEPAPGVAASTHLAFALQSVPGAPAEPITIPVGTKVQSVPGQDETAQVFETVEPAPARAEWNAIPPRLTERRVPQVGDTSLWLAGVAPGLEPGSAILIVGGERLADPESDRWAVRVLSRVEPDDAAGRTRVEWADPLEGDLPETAVEVHVLRQRAALFGHNAPDPNLMGNDDSNVAEKIDKSDPDDWRWNGFAMGSVIDIEPQNPKIVAGSWLALVSNEPGSGTADLPGEIRICRAASVTQQSRQDFAIASKITRVTPVVEDSFADFDLRQTLVLAQSERLEIAATPLFHPLHDDVLTLGRRVEGLVPKQPIALSGKRQPVVVRPGVTELTLELDDGKVVELVEGDRLFMLGPAVWQFPGNIFFPPFSIVLSAEVFLIALDFAFIDLKLRLMDRDGRTGTLLTPATNVKLGQSAEDDPTIREIAFVASGLDSVTVGRDATTLKLSEAMGHVYERATLRINANVAPATHGETVEMILGDGDGRRANQRFALNQQPLTYVNASTPSGRASTLQVRVNDVLWAEAPTLYQAAPGARAYETFQTDDKVTIVQFGDGEEGARLPSGATNVRAKYRKGLGTGGNVTAGKITTLLSRPLGLAEAVNPSPATGGEDPETLDRARRNAPLTTLTLDRAVSIADYRNFARAFAGIDKAHALWIPSGIARGVFLTVAGVDGAEVPEAGATYANLGDALRTYGDPLVPIRIVNHQDSRFRIKASVKVSEAHEPDRVLADVEEALRTHFGFAAREFGQTVSVDEVAAAAHSVAGVEAVHVAQLYREGEPALLYPRIFARLPVASLTALPQPAELLALTDDPVELDEMT